MRFASTSFLLATLLSMLMVFSNSDGYAIGQGSNGAACCTPPCSPSTPNCDCLCRPPMLPQFPPLLPPMLLPPPVFPQFPTYPSGGGYATPVQQPVMKNAYQQQPSSYKVPFGIAYQQFQPYQNGGAFGYGVKQEQAGGAYATNPFGVDNGNFGGAQQVVANENRFGEGQQELPASGTGQHASRQVGHSLEAADSSGDVTAGTFGAEYNSSPATTEYEKKTKSFLKLRKSQLA